MDHAWTCRCCGKQFNTILLDMAFKAPDHWFQKREEERERIGKLGDDICIIEQDIFIRGVIEIPIIGVDDHFRWGTWVSVSEESFKRVIELWRAPVVEGESPKFGWLCSKLSLYPDTLHLKTNLHLRGKRPLIELEPIDPPTRDRATPGHLHNAC